jgi:asparagine synthase (glutamine-hydrolysing)
MSGVIGLVYLDGRPVERKTVDQMVNSIFHRGPDGDSTWIDGMAGLGHLLLQTTPESAHEQQPLVHAGGRYALVADARIDNRDELASYFDFRRPIREVPDSLFIMAAYEKWEDDCLDHLLGDFSFAVWDRHNKRLFCARDPVGVKPFYYVHLPGKLFAFAAEPKALFGLDPSFKRLNYTRVAEFLALPDQFVNEPTETSYEKILRLPAGHFLSVRKNGMEQSRYWRIQPETLQLNSMDQYVNAFKETFQRAVSSRQRASSSVASMLSGGLDSSSIVGMANHLSGRNQKIHTLSAVFPNVPEKYLPFIDERKYLHKVIGLESVDPHYIEADRIDPFWGVEHAVAAFDRPFLGGNHAYHWRAFQWCGQEEVRVLLDGKDGDTVISHGHEYMQHYASRRDWEKLSIAIGSDGRLSEDETAIWELFNRAGGWKSLCALAEQGDWGQFLKEVRSASNALNMKPSSVLGGPHAPWTACLTLPLKILRQRYSRKQEAQDASLNTVDILNPALRDHLVESEKEEPGSDNPLSAHRTEVMRPQWQYVFELSNAMTEQFGVEERYPFFDKRLVELCVRLPGDMKRHEGWDRFVLRKAMEGIVPEEVRWREQKSTLRPGYVTSFLHSGGKTRADKVILQDPSYVEEFVDLEKLRSQYQAYCENAYSESELDLNISRAVVLDAWLRHLDE